MSESFNDGNARKVLFLFVPAEAETEIIKNVAAHEYEVYTINENLDSYLAFIKDNPNSVIFTYGGNYPKNARWKDHYTMLTTCCSDNGIMISTWHDDENYLKPDHELTNYKPTVDHIDISNGYSSILPYILNFLERINARGRRHFVRLRCDDYYSATFSIKKQTEIFTGRILDISSIGMACAFDKNIELKINTLIEDVQLRLGGHVVGISGTIFGKRDIDGKTIYVIVFDFKKFPEARARIVEYIYSSLQKLIRNMKTAGEK
jgi:hypothetical protein